MKKVSKREIKAVALLSVLSMSAYALDGDAGDATSEGNAAAERYFEGLSLGVIAGVSQGTSGLEGVSYEADTGALKVPGCEATEKGCKTATRASRSTNRFQPGMGLGLGYGWLPCGKLFVGLEMAFCLYDRTKVTLRQTEFVPGNLRVDHNAEGKEGIWKGKVAVRVGRVMCEGKMLPYLEAGTVGSEDVVSTADCKKKRFIVRPHVGFGLERALTRKWSLGLLAGCAWGGGWTATLSEPEKGGLETRSTYKRKRRLEPSLEISLRFRPNG